MFHVIQLVDTVYVGFVLFAVKCSLAVVKKFNANKFQRWTFWVAAAREIFLPPPSSTFGFIDFPIQFFFGYLYADVYSVENIQISSSTSFQFIGSGPIINHSLFAQNNKLTGAFASDGGGWSKLDS